MADSRGRRSWSRVIARDGGRLILLGTPNNGSHAMVKTLLGKSGTVRTLARIDLRHDLQELLDIVGQYPGALQLLPRPGFLDSGSGGKPDYFVHALWKDELAKQVRDRWFGDGTCAVPAAAALATARTIWETTLAANTVPNPDRVSYVFGQAENTPCGVRSSGGKLLLEGTPEGDGSVTWLSGRLDNLPEDRQWLMPVEHADLTDARDHFPALLDLLERGTTDKLARAPQSRSEGSAVRLYDAGPPAFPARHQPNGRSSVAARVGVLRSANASGYRSESARWICVTLRCR